MLVYLESPTIAAKGVKALMTAPTQEEQIDFARSLRVLKSGWTPELRKTYFEWFLKAHHYRGGASFMSFVDNIKRDAVATLRQRGDLRFRVDLARGYTGWPIYTWYFVEAPARVVAAELAGHGPLELRALALG